MPETVSYYIDSINGSVLLPGIQRRFAWDESQIELLFDSLLNGYPIGSLIRYRSKTTDTDYIAYKFITNYIDEDERIPQHIEDSFDNFNRENQILENGQSKLSGGGVFQIENQQHTMIIDGQQRLTALNIGYNGSLLNYHAGSEGALHGGKGKPEHWEKKYLCIDLLKERTDTHEGWDEYEDLFSFKSNRDIVEFETDSGHTCLGELSLSDETAEFWVSIPSITLENQTQFITGIKDGLKKAKSKFEGYSGEFSDSQKTTIGTILNEFNSVAKTELKDETWDRSYTGVPEIFSRINMEGETVGADDLLMTKFMQQWVGTLPDDKVPRLVIDNMVHNLQRDSSTGFEKEVDWELLLTIICNINGDKLTKKVAKNPELESMKQILYGDDPTGNGTYEFREAVRQPLIDLTDLGLPESTVPKKLLAALVVYYHSVYRSDNNIQINPTENKNNLFQFIAATLLLNSIDADVMRRSKAFDAIDAIDESELETNAFPVEAALGGFGGVPSLADLEELFTEKRYTSDGDIQKSASGILGILGVMDWADDVEDSQIDHLYPKSKAESLGVQEDTLHRLGNLQLLQKSTNKTKGTTSPRAWLNSPDVGAHERREYVRKNIHVGYSKAEVNDLTDLSGNYETDLQESNCEAFIEAREVLMVNRIQEIFA